MSSKRQRLTVALGVRLLLAGMVAGAVALVAAFAGLTGVSGDSGFERVRHLSGGNGYWLAGAQGAVYSFGDAPDLGSAFLLGSQAMAAMAATPTGQGYWLVTTTGLVTAYGDATLYGGVDDLRLVKPIVGMAATATGRGYWLVASDGGLFAFGDAGFFGSMGAEHLNKPITGMAPTRSGRGYWFVATDGGVFSFGDAGFFGSMGGEHLNKPIVAMSPTPAGGGYWFTASDGGVFAFGDAGFYGSMGDKPLNQPINGMAATPTGKGYWFVAKDGGMFNFGDALFLGSAVGRGQTVVAMVPSPQVAINTVPLATNDAATTDEDHAVSIDVLANDTGLDDGPLTVTLDSRPASGTASVSGSRVLYTPAADFFGTDSFRYRVSDVDGDSSAATVTVAVRPVNDSPSLSTLQAASVDEDGTTSQTFTIADAETAAGGLSVTATSSDTTLVPNGNITVTGSGANRTIGVRPAPDRNGSATITVQVSDGTLTTTRQFSLTVRPVNDRPTITALANQTIAEDTPTAKLAFTVGDPDDSAGSLVVSASSSDEAVIRPEGFDFGGSGANRTLQVTPRQNRNGTATITVTVSDGSLTASRNFTVTVTPVNDAPTATSGLTISTNEDTTGSTTLTGTDVDGDTLTFAVAANGAKGTATVNATTGAVTYAPNANANGADAFTYTVNDGAATSTPATVNVTIIAVNDTPVAQADTAATLEDTAVGVNVLANDTGVGDSPLAVSLVGSPSTGTATVNPDRTITYTPPAEYSGTATFDYLVVDADGESSGSHVTVTVTAVNDPPVLSAIADQTILEDGTTGSIALTVSDVDSPVGALTLSGASSNSALVDTGFAFGGSSGARTLVVTPKANANGTATLTVTATDPGGATASRSFTLTVTAVNDAPTASPASFVTDEDTPLTGAVTGNDVEGSALTFTAVAPPGHGTLTLDAGGHFTYSPAANYHGPDSFTFTVSDGTASSAETTVTLSVTSVNDTPVAVSANLAVTEDQAQAGTLAGTDADNDALTYEVMTDGAHGHVVLVNAATGAFTYTPAADFHGTDAFTFRVSDGTAASAPATVTVTVASVNDVPAPVADSATTNEDTSARITVLANDTGLGDGSIAGGTLHVTVDSQPAAGGTATVNSDGTITFVPAADWSGTATFVYRVTDPEADTGTATVTVTVSPVNDPPTITGTAGVTVLEDGTTGAIAFTVADVDDPAAGLTLTASSSPTTLVTDAGFTFGGSGASRTLVITPAANANGTGTITVTVKDAAGASSTTSFALTVTPVNDAPTGTALSFSTDEEVVHIGTLAGVDVDGDPLTFQLAANPTGGTISVSSSGGFTYTPLTNFSGSDSFGFTVSDGALTSATATVSITVNPVNDPPTISAVNDLTVNEDTPTAALAVTVHDVETADGSLTLTAASSDTNLVPVANVVFGGSGGARTVTVTPAANRSGTATITLTVTDGGGTTATEAFILSVTAVNDPPVANPDHISILLGGTTTIDVRANDSDVDNALTTLVVTKLTDPTRGTVTCTAAGMCTYHANSILTSDSFTYRLTDPSGLWSDTTVTIN